MGKKTSAFNKQVFSERIKNYILNLIVEGNVKPGQRIVESTLAKELGVSQAPVREAIRDLVLVGILRNESYHGTFVCDFTEEDLIQAYQVRAAIESKGIQLAVQRMTDEEVHLLEGIFQKLMNASREPESPALMDLDNLLHGEIMRLSGNKVLYNLWTTLKYDIWTKITYSKVKDKRFLAARHEALIRSIVERNPDEASACMNHHILDLHPLFSRK